MRGHVRVDNRPGLSKIYHLQTDFGKIERILKESTLSPVILALTICLVTGISRVFLKFGLKGSNPLSGTFVSIVIGWFALLLLSLTFDSFVAVSWQGVAFFSLIGCVAPPLVRYLTYIGVDRVGACRSDLLRSLTPFFAILFATMIFGETIGMTVFAGALLIVSGIALITYFEGKSEAEKKWKKEDLIFPLAAACLAGLIANMRKFGTEFLSSPFVASFVAATSALIVFSLMIYWRGLWGQIKFEKKAGRFLLLSGLCTSLTDVLDLIILKQAKVSVVVPILAVSPLVTIMFSGLFLRKTEFITKWLLISGFLVVLGVELIVSSRG